MTTATLSKARSLKRDRLRQLIIDVATSNPSADEIIARADAIGVEIDALDEPVRTYRDRLGALADLERIKEIDNEVAELTATNKVLGDELTALAERHRREEKAKRLPIHQNNAEIERLRQEANSLRYNATMTLRQTEDPAIEKTLADLARQATPARQRLANNQKELDRLEQSIAKLEAELAEVPQDAPQTVRAAERLDANSKRLAAMRNNLPNVKAGIREDESTIRRIEAERDEWIRRKSDPMSFAI